MQSRRWSLIETVVGTMSGFGLALFTNYFLMPILFGVKPTMIGNLTYTLVFTIISMCRQYCVRRFLNWLYEVWHQMNHVKHPQTNFTFTAPPNMKNCDDLAVVRGTMQDTQVILSYWKPTAEELAELNAGGHVRLDIVGTAMPPVMVSVVNEALTSV